MLQTSAETVRPALEKKTVVPAALEKVLTGRPTQQTEHNHTLEGFEGQIADIGGSLAEAFAGFDDLIHDLRNRHRHSRAEVRKLSLQVKELEQQRREDVEQLTRMQESFSGRFAAHERLLLALYKRRQEQGQE